AGFRSGTFTAFTDAGALLDGTFECGAGRDPVPLSLGDDDGRLDTVDAVALLRRGQFERLVGFAVTADDAEVQCPAAESTAPATDVVVRVAGDASIGAVTEFGLTGGAAPALDLRVGASDYRFADVTITVDGATGTFSGSADGVTVDGAYRCT
ncbi:MAG: hypothetical protein HKN41_11170, partial [Ilumatobacter sp.]|nr:hypothetical protein [Ilumatobacter sp.]